MKIALAQTNPTVGDLEANADAITGWIERAAGQGARLVLFPELALTGYPPDDLLLKEQFLQDAREALERVVRSTGDIVALVGFPEFAQDVHNALGVIHGGELKGVYRKIHLPNYGVFDEQRYFGAGGGGKLIEVDGVRIGLTVCEDVWEPGPPAADEALSGATLVVNASASPYHRGKGVERERMVMQRAIDSRCAFALCNVVGGQDELVFDGHSVVVDHRGEVVARGRQFEEDLVIATLDEAGAHALRLRDPRHRTLERLGHDDLEPVVSIEPDGDRPEADSTGGERTELLDPLEEVYAALRRGVKDYVDKNGFPGVVLGLSGGIDSALTARIAVDALGADRVVTVVMPSRFSSEDTQSDARTMAESLGTTIYEVPIAPLMQGFDQALADAFAGRDEDITEENIQARIRGTLLMALSNKFGWLLLTTGNKSEVSVGYSTLYGDSAGGFAPIKDVSKTLVYELSRISGVPSSIVERPPSAELRADQKDEDSLPPYARLDPILEAYIEDELPADAIARMGFDRDEVDEVLRLVDRAEHKRRQSPPGIKVTPRAFGRDRRMPITQHYRG
jgi:NAD+ synthase (glutamine-hydrolysing)